MAKQCSGLDKGQVTCWNSWHRWSAVCLLAYTCLAVAVAVERARDAVANAAAAMIAVTVPEMARMLRGPVIPLPRRDRDHLRHWSDWRRRHQHSAQQAHQRWNVYADTVT